MSDFDEKLRKIIPPLPPPPHVIVGDVIAGFKDAADEARTAFEHGPIQAVADAGKTIVDKMQRRVGE